MQSHHVVIVWFRRDLRLTDNPALERAAAGAARIVPVYIHDEGADWPMGAASRWWLHRSLTALEGSLRTLSSRLIVRQGPSATVLDQLIRETGATLVTWNRLYEPAAVERDQRVKAAIIKAGVEAVSCNAALLFEPWNISNAQQRPYRVFTPFWRTALAQIDALPAPARAPTSLAGPARWPASISIDSLRLEPEVRWDSGLAARWQPGEAGAHRMLESFGHTADRYMQRRDRPDQRGTSSLSPHLHFGEIGPRQILAALQSQLPAAQGARSLAVYLKELGWREFAHHLLFHFPHTRNAPLDQRFLHWRWSRSRNDLKAWQRGLTGVPIVDAGMRELWHTGWMHNRVRMIVASFLTKNLQIHWLAGARWFWDTLVDADLANNTLGWQWTAGCGADAAPYYRIFNPVLQAEKFDPDRAYIRRWIPELAQLPDRWIHQPWAAPGAVLTTAGVTLGSTYPHPIVDLKRSRGTALAAYQHISQPQ